MHLNFLASYYPSFDDYMLYHIHENLQQLNSVEGESLCFVCGDEWGFSATHIAVTSVGISSKIIGLTQLIDHRF